MRVSRDVSEKDSKRKMLFLPPKGKRYIQIHSSSISNFRITFLRSANLFIRGTEPTLVINGPKNKLTVLTELFGNSLSDRSLSSIHPPFLVYRFVNHLFP